MPFIKHKRYLLPFATSPIPTQGASGAVIGELVLCTATGRVWSVGSPNNATPWVPFPVAPIAVGETNPGVRERVFFDQGGTAPAELLLKREVGGVFTNQVPTTFTNDFTLSSLVSSLVSTDGTGKLVATNLNASTLLGRRSGSSGAAEAVTVGTGLTMTAGADLSVSPAFIQEEVENDFLRPNNPSLFRDEFCSLTLTTGLIGELGWRFTNGSVSAPNAVTGHPGVIQRTSSATTNQVSSFYLNATTTGTLFVWENFEQMTFHLKADTAGADFTLRFGVGTSADGNSPGSGAWFERLATNAYFTPVLKQGANLNSTAVQWPLDTNWHTFHIHRLSRNSVKFQVDGGTQYTESIPVGGGILDTDGLQWFLQIIPTTASARSCSIDFFSSKLGATSR
jgi:hypothetical protein